MQQARAKDASAYSLPYLLKVTHEHFQADIVGRIDKFHPSTEIALETSARYDASDHD
jgi:hypothetical protein